MGLEFNTDDETLTSFPNTRVVMTLLAATVKSPDRSTAPP